MIARRALRALALAVILAVGCARRQAPPQPLPFDHSIHTRVALADRPLTCTDCHAGAKLGAHAGLPALATCLRCHMRPQGDPPSERERLVRLAAAKGGPFRWIQVTRNPGHVFFSHAAHTTLAKIECATCHGDVTRWRTPPRDPEPKLKNMRLCMNCHRERGAPNSCETCHQ